MLIRLATPEDGQRLAGIYRPAVATAAISFELQPLDGPEMGRRVASVMARMPWLVGQEDGLVLGYAYASPHRDRPGYAWSVEVSAYLDPAAHRFGLGRALYTSLFAILSLQGFQNAYAGITLPNDASVGFHEALGFVLVGTYHGVGFKHGQWRSVRWYERSLGSQGTDPPSPRPLPVILKDPAFPQALAAGETALRSRSRAEHFR